MSLVILFLPSGAGGPQNYGYTGTGGDIDGGAALYLRNAGFTMSGGDLDGGAVNYLRNAGITMTGGDIDGGEFSAVGTLGRSGTTVVSVSPDSIFILPDGRKGKLLSGSTYLKL